MKREEKCKCCSILFKVYMSRKDVKYCSIACKRIDYKSWHPYATKKYVKLKKECIPQVAFRWITATDEQKLNRLRNNFEKHVIKNEGCWGWNGVLHKAGYATMIHGADYKNIGAHRVSWLIHIGDIPQDKIILHTCDNKSCTNPDHLSLGSYKENTQDMLKKKRNKPACGSRNTQTKLNEEKVKEIRKLLDLGVTMKRISNDYQMSNGAISAIKNKITWKNIG